MPLAAFGNPYGILHAAEGPVRLVVDRGTIDVDRTGFQFQRASHREQIVGNYR